MPAVVAYIVVEGTSRQLLEAAVKEAMSRGWQPLGGLCVAEGIFYQAMAGH